jgi:hypothetical protein
MHVRPPPHPSKIIPEVECVESDAEQAELSLLAAWLSYRRDPEFEVVGLDVALFGRS